MQTYSFLDVKCALVGPGVAVNLGASAGIAEEGITIEPTEEINNMTVGADGSVMHSLHGNKSGKVTIRVLKTSPVNAALALAYAFQTSSAATHGANTVSLADNRGDSVTMQQVAFAKAPTLVYAKDGGMNEWEFHAGLITRILAPA